MDIREKTAVTIRRLKQEALSTLTSTSGEAPREAPPAGLVDAYEQRFDQQAERAVLGDAIAAGTGFSLGGEHVPIEQVKVSSPELATLAAAYIKHDDPNVRALAASVLSQAPEKIK